jgi:hypothetical protein
VSSGPAPAQASFREPPPGAGSLCLRCGWLPAPEVDTCPTCAATSYRSNELGIARSTARSRRDVRLAITFAVCAPIVLLALVVVEELYRPRILNPWTVIIGAFALAFPVQHVWTRRYVPAVETAVRRSGLEGRP